jgi:hypothetical protein
MEKSEASYVRRGEITVICGPLLIKAVTFFQNAI